MNPRHLLLADVASRIPISPGPDCIRVAVDGPDASGKTTFANELADHLHARNRPVIRISTDDFHHPRAIRYRRGRDSPEGFFLDSHDYPTLRHRVLDPLGPGGSRLYQPASHDLATDLPLSPPPRQAPPGSVLILDGLFLHRDELAPLWDLSIYLQVPFGVSIPRMAARDGTHPDPTHPTNTRYVQAHRLYLAACTPHHRATLVIDNSHLPTPTLLNAR